MSAQITRMSSLFLRTLRDDPADAEVPSHQLLVRAGYVRRAAPGIYSWLPLGYRVLRNVERIVREEMDRIGAQEVHFPALLPREPYETTGRWTEYGDNLFRLKDRKGGDYLLGPTHEEMFTLLVKDIVSSYKSLPLALYQIQTKYRDEARPRAGILRGREFVMKDSYSFDLDDAGLEASYQRHREAYIRIFDRLGLRYVIVAAMSGAMGGSASEEFLADSDVGEDTYVRSPGGYAANVEAVTTPWGAANWIDHAPAHVEDTPDTPTIDTLVAVSNELHPQESGRPWTGADTLKNVIVNLRHPDGTVEPLAVGLPGDREVDLKRLEAHVAPAEIEPFTEADFARNPALVKGYIGPGVLGETNTSKIRYLLDRHVGANTAWITGADAPGKHVFNLVFERDFTADGWVEAAEIREGDPAPDGSGPLSLARGIEMGHIFQLGRKYADALGLQVLDRNGKRVTVTMGSYGVGVSRAVAAVAENSHDDKGLIWPRELSPADLHLVIAGKQPEIAAAATTLAEELSAAGISVMLDDRNLSPGVKFTDAELIGVPTILVVGRGVAGGLLELKDRRTGITEEVALDGIVDRLVELVRN